MCFTIIKKIITFSLILLSIGVFGQATKTVVINEVMASNSTTVTDQDGEYDDWIEVYNTTNATINLSGYFLSDDADALDKYAIPAGTTISANGYLIIWADNDVDQTGLHATFKLSATGEAVFLSNTNATIIDEVTFGAQNTDVSLARSPNGTGDFTTQAPTFNGTNDNAIDGPASDIGFGEIVINEFVAANDSTSTITDDNGQYEDWIELYNNTNQAIDLTGVFLSNNKTNLKEWRFPNGTSIAANGYLIIWADEDLNQEGLHANFKLAKSGDELRLVNTDESIIDSLTFPEQKTNIGYARMPNGTGAFAFKTTTFNANNDDGTTSTDQELLAANNWKIYPNPMQHELFIERTTASQASEEMDVKIYDMLGKLMLSKRERTSKMQLFVGNLTPSVYLVVVNGNIGQKLLLVR